MASLKEITDLIIGKITKKDQALLARAYEFSQKAHKDQKRMSGDPYFVHVYETSKILASLGMDTQTIAAGLLHDVLEESAKSYREKFVGQRMSVLWESTSEMGEWGWQMEGLTENYLRVSAFAPSPRWNELDKVQLNQLSDNGLKGEIVSRNL